MDLKKNIKFRIGKEDWDMPLGVLLLLAAIAFIMIVGGVYFGFKFGQALA